MLMNGKEVQAFLNLSRVTFNRLLKAGVLPEPVNPADVVKLWSRPMLQKWLENGGLRRVVNSENNP